MRSEKTKQAYNVKPGTLFLIYFIVITAVLLWGLFHCTNYSWITADAFRLEDASGLAESDGEGSRETVKQKGQEDGLTELKDDAPLSVKVKSDSEITYWKKLRLRGVGLLGYENTRNLQFSDEIVAAQVIDTNTGKVIGEGLFPLKNQMVNPGSRPMIYITLHEPAAGLEPDDLEVRFSSQGLTRNGVFLSGEKTGVVKAGGSEAESGADNKAAGNAETAPAARLYFEKKTWNPILPVLCFLVEAVAGLGCLLLFGERRLPLLRRAQKSPAGIADPDTEQAPAEEPLKDGRLWMARGKKLLVPIAVTFLILFVMLYTYLRVVRKAAIYYDADFLTGGSSTEAFELTPDMSVRQAVTASEDDFSGIGIRLTDKDGNIYSPVKAAPYSDAVLQWQILDETGTASLTGGSAAVRDLKSVSKALGKDILDEAIVTAAGESVLLRFDNPLKESKGKRFVLQLTVVQQGQEPVYLLAASDTNGQIAVSGEGQQSVPAELCLVGTYTCNGFFKSMFARMCAVVLIMIIALYVVERLLARSKEDPAKKAAVMYLVSALSMGMVFSFLTPAYTISDERTHIDTVYILSNQLLGIRGGPGPEYELKRACDIDSSIKNTMPVTVERYRVADRELFRAAPKKTGEEETEIPFGRTLTPVYARNAMANAYALCYLPGAIGFSIARLLGRNMITMIMAARWINLLACVLIMYMAVRRMPYGAAAMAVVGLFPKTLQQMSSCSYDGMIISIIYLFIALCLKAAFDDNLCIADLLGLQLTGMFAGSCKGGAYLPVLGLLFLIPAVRAGTSMQKRTRIPWGRICAVTLIGTFLLFAGKNMFMFVKLADSSAGSAINSGGTKYLYTISDFIHAPVKLVRIYLNTFYMRDDGLLGELVGKNLSQKWYIIYMFLALAILGMTHKNRGGSDRGKSLSTDRKTGREPAVHFGIPGKIWILLLVAGSTSLVFLSMLITFTSRDMTYVDGLQGRYFLPLAPLILLVLENDRIHRDGIRDTALLYTADVLLAVTFCEIILRYIGGN